MVLCFATGVQTAGAIAPPVVYTDASSVSDVERVRWADPPVARTVTWVSLQGVDKVSLVGVSHDAPPTTPMVLPVVVTVRGKWPDTCTLLGPAAMGETEPVISGVGGMLFEQVACFPGGVAGGVTGTMRVECVKSIVRTKIASDGASQVIPPPVTMTDPAAWTPGRSGHFTRTEHVPLVTGTGIPAGSDVIAGRNV